MPVISHNVEFHFLSTWDVYLKFGTLVHHVPGATKLASDFLVFALGLSYGLSNSKNGVNSSLNF